MKAISIRQPWAELILKNGKDIENRDWPTQVRGRVLIHAAKGCTQDEFEDAIYYAETITRINNYPNLKTIQRGGIVGSVIIANCVTRSDSPWFMGKYGFVLMDPQPINFIPWKGQLGFFEVPDAILYENAKSHTA